MLKFLGNKFRKKSFPEYWVNYLKLFENKPNLSIPISQSSFVVIDVESTGLSPKKDLILSIGAVKVRNLEICVRETFEVYLLQENYKPENVSIHGILKNSKKEKIKETKAMRLFIEFIQDSILVGHSIAFDIAIINETFKRILGDTIKNRRLDTIDLYKRMKGGDFRLGDSVSLDKLCDEFNIPKSDRHNAAGDALITAILFLKLITRLREREILTLKELFRKKNLLY